jgi:hypothetical protein
VDLIAGLLILAGLVFFFTPSKYLGAGGWGAFLSVAFLFNVTSLQRPFYEWSTWAYALVGIPCLAVWLHKKPGADKSSPEGEEEDAPRS